MEKKLPGVYANNKSKISSNNEKVSYSSLDKIEGSEKKDDRNVSQKINDIFNSRNYVYKADVVINLKNKEIVKRVIGRNNNYLITIENELIPISDIVDIKEK